MNVTVGTGWQEENPEDFKVLLSKEWLPTGSHDWCRRFQAPVLIKRQNAAGPSHGACKTPLRSPFRHFFFVYRTVPLSEFYLQGDSLSPEY
jgi:hypothetical protein